MTDCSYDAVSHIHKKPHKVSPAGLVLRDYRDTQSGRESELRILKHVVLIGQDVILRILCGSVTEGAIVPVPTFNEYETALPADSSD